LTRLGSKMSSPEPFLFHSSVTMAVMDMNCKSERHMTLLHMGSSIGRRKEAPASCGVGIGLVRLIIEKLFLSVVDIEGSLQRGELIGLLLKETVSLDW
jgi:hypothetical protein